MAVRFIQGEKTFDTGECWQGLNLLGHAQLIELFIGSKCGGHGECGADRVRLSKEDQNKVNPVNAVEREFLSEAQILEGYRIACQCFPNGDGMQITAMLAEKKNG